jgi:hypothetical protein
MAALRCTLTHAVHRLQLAAISEESVRKAWKGALLSTDQRQQLLRESLSRWTTRLSKSRRRRGWDVAIDLLHEPYYGKTSPEVFRGQFKQGTRRFWSTATAAVVHHGERFTLAIASVRTNQMVEALEALWPQLEALNIHIRRLLVDRGFYSAKVVRWLQAHQLSFLMPMIRRGRRGTGTTPFFRRGRSGFARYQWRERNRGGVVEVGVAMVPSRDRRRGPRVYVYGGRPPGLEVCQAVYRRRFGIESSYRQCHQSLGWTTSPNADWRRLLMVLSLVVRNLWIVEQRPGPRGLRVLGATYLMFLARVDLTPLRPPTDPSAIPRLTDTS